MARYGFLLLVVFTWMLTGCIISEMPASTRDGQVVLLDNQVIWTCDPHKGTAQPHHLPQEPEMDWEVRGAVILNDTVWVRRTRTYGQMRNSDTGKPVYDEETGEVIPEHEDLWLPFDLRTNRFLENGPSLRSQNLMILFAETPIVAGYEGKPRLIVSTFPFLSDDRHDGLNQTAIDLDDFQKRSEVPSDEIMPAGMGWSIRVVTANPPKNDPLFPGLASMFSALKLCDPTGATTCTIPAAVLALTYEMRAFAGPFQEGPDPIVPEIAVDVTLHYLEVPKPTCAIMARDGSAVAIVFERERRGSSGMDRTTPSFQYYARICSAKSGKLLWSAEGNSLTGTPLVTQNALWTLTENLRALVLMKYTPGADPSKFGAPKEVLMYDLGVGNEIGSFAPDLKGENLLVAVHGPRPRLLIVPVRDGLKREEVVSIDLKAPAPGSK